MKTRQNPSALEAESLPPELHQLLILASDGDMACHENGSVLIRENSRDNPLLLIETGQVEINTSYGNKVIVQAPTVMGEQSLLSGKPTNATVIAKGTAGSRAVKEESFWELIRTNTYGKELLQSLTRLNLDRLKGRFHPKPYVVLVADDARKDDLFKTAEEFTTYLQKQPLLSTESNSKRMQEELNLPVGRVVRSGPKGGIQEVGTLVLEGLVKAVFFFPDPLTSQPHFMDTGALQRVCDVCQVPIATNRASAKHLLRSLSATDAD
ncbi:MAG: Methylglyoxal synthase [Prochlorococcus marinus str. MIT 9215]|nr:MAG: Methylglyoxal synthase [Prochlorococcus marinus str. MIT 9215]